MNFWNTDVKGLKYARLWLVIISGTGIMIILVQFMIMHQESLVMMMMRYGVMHHHTHQDHEKQSGNRSIAHPFAKIQYS